MPNRIKPDSHIDTPKDDMHLIEVKVDHENALFDIQLLKIQDLQEYDSVEVDIIFFPHSRNINSKDYSFEPFEEYKHESDEKDGIYNKRVDLRAVLAGLSVSGFLSGIAAQFNPKNLAEVETMLALAGGRYTGYQGRERYIEGYVINKASKGRIQFKEEYYKYALKKMNTFSKYATHSRKLRYGMHNIRPLKMNCIEYSTSQVVRMYFSREQLESLGSIDRANILSINMDSDKFDEVKNGEFDIGVHIKLGQRKYGLDRKTELLQTLSDGKYGYVGENGKFRRDQVEMRETISLNRFKYYKHTFPTREKIIRYIDDAQQNIVKQQKNIEQQEVPPLDVPTDIQELAQQRREAKQHKDYKSADTLRDQIREKGWKVQDTNDTYILVPITHTIENPTTL